MDIKEFLFSGSILKKVTLVLVGIGAFAGAFWYINTYIYRSSAAIPNQPVNLTLIPSTANLNFASTKNFSIAFNISGQKVRAADIFIEYDSNIVEYYKEYTNESGYSELKAANAENYFTFAPSGETVIDKGSGKKVLHLSLYSIFNDTSNPNWTTSVTANLKFRAKKTGLAPFTVLKGADQTLIAGVVGTGVAEFALPSDPIATEVDITIPDPTTAPTTVPAITVRSTVTGNIIKNDKAAAPTFPCTSVKGQWCIFDNSTGTATISNPGKLQLRASNMAANTFACWVQRLDVTAIGPKRYTVTANINRPAAPTGGKIVLRTGINDNSNLHEKVITGTGNINYFVDIPATATSANIRYCLYQATFASATTVTLNSIGIVQSVIPPTNTPTATIAPTATAGPAAPTTVPAITVRSTVTGNIIKNDKAAAPTFPCTGVKGEWCMADNSTGTASITSTGKLRLVGPNVAPNTYACWVQRLNIVGNIAPKRYTVTANIARPAAPTAGKIAFLVRTAKNNNLHEKVINANGNVSYSFDILETDVNALDEATNIRLCLFGTTFASATNITLNSIGIVQSDISADVTPTLTPTLTPTTRPIATHVPTATPTGPTATATPVPGEGCPRRAEGDATCDGVINSEDYVCWRGQYVDGALGAQCRYTDFDQIGGTALLDFAIWKVNAGSLTN